MLDIYGLVFVSELHSVLVSETSSFIFTVCYTGLNSLCCTHHTGKTLPEFPTLIPLLWCVIE